MLVVLIICSNEVNIKHFVFGGYTMIGRSNLILEWSMSVIMVDGFKVNYLPSYCWLSFYLFLT